jgi:hypothetical protein
MMQSKQQSEAIIAQVHYFLIKSEKSGKQSLMKLYVIVRKDLSPSQRAVQAGHAVAEFLLRGPFSRWSNGTLVYLGVKGLNQLENLKYKLKQLDIKFAEFREPDIGNETTAIATDINCELFERLRLL